MNLEKYALKISQNKQVFEFTSEGKNGSIEKIIIFTEIQSGDNKVFNLGFGDKGAIDGEIDDSNISDNGDRDKVLATVAWSIYLFTDQNLDSWIYIEGSTPARTRLYQMGIGRYVDEITEDYVIYELKNDTWELFETNVNYSAFLISRK